MDALAFLDHVSKASPQPVYAVTGDEAFLKRQVILALQSVLLGDADPSFALMTVAGDAAEWSTIRNELSTLPFLAPCRLVVIDAADPFVTNNRAALEKYVASPAKSGTLVLEVKSWASTTKLAKALKDEQTIVCKAPPANKLSLWCSKWCKSHYGTTLESDAAAWLVELVGNEMGLLDRELDKLAVYVGAKGAISRDDVEVMVGRSRGAETFKMFDAIGQSRPREALAILRRLLEQGEDPMAILGAVSWQCRRLAQIHQQVRTGKTVFAAMDQIGVPPFAREGLEKQLVHLGRGRVGQLYDWLVETDLAMKTTDALKPAILIERLIVRMARPNPARGGAVNRAPRP